MPDKNNKANDFKTFEYADRNFDIMKHFGQMNDPSGASYMKGPCGDFMEFYLIINDGKIAEINYYTEGCDATRTCAAVVSIMALNKTLIEALKISAGTVLEKISGLPDGHRHCAILSVSAFYSAIADYWLRP